MSYEYKSSEEINTTRTSFVEWRHRLDDFSLEESESVTLADSSFKTSLTLRLPGFGFGGAFAATAGVAGSSACTTRTNAGCFGDNGDDAGRR